MFFFKMKINLRDAFAIRSSYAFTSETGFKYPNQKLQFIFRVVFLQFDYFDDFFLM